MKKHRKLLQDVLKVVDAWLKSEDTFVTEANGNRIEGGLIGTKSGSLTSRLAKIMPKESEFVEEDNARFSKDYIKQLYEYNIQKNGVSFQLNMVVEEAAELIQAINKVRRAGIVACRITKPNDSMDLEHVRAYNNACSEAADLRIMLEQLEMMLDKERIDISYERKLTRVAKRIGFVYQATEYPIQHHAKFLQNKREEFENLQSKVEAEMKDPNSISNIVMDMKEGLDNAIQASNPLFGNYKHLNKNKQKENLFIHIKNEEGCEILKESFFEELRSFFDGLLGHKTFRIGHMFLSNESDYIFSRQHLRVFEILEDLGFFENNVKSDYYKLKEQALKIWLEFCNSEGYEESMRLAERYTVKLSTEENNDNENSK